MIIVPVEKKIDWRRPPLVLIALVAINILVFAFYQSGDDNLVFEAADHYQRNDMLDTEWRAYQEYIQDKNQDLVLSKSDENTVYYIVSDPSFDRFMADSGAQYIPMKKREQWREHREQLVDISSKISFNAFGFQTDEISFVQLLSSQFLHGGVMHLVGNMVFLILVGFAVEAALGSRLFLFFYLISGAAGALFYAALSTSSGLLVGASGSISGVMAMYVVLFGMRKIEFFYWIFVFTGYLRAAAIIMLPVYIIKEVYSYLTLEGSNVAFTAHIGGFVAGAALVMLVQRYRSQVIDEDYLDNKPKQVDQTDVALQRIYDHMGDCEFAKAWSLLKPIKKRYPERPDIIELEFNLVRAHHPAKTDEYLIHRMDKAGNSDKVMSAQLRYWRSLEPEQQDSLNQSKRSALLSNALSLNSFEVAELVFTSFNNSDIDNMSKAVMARQISSAFRESNKLSKAEKYAQFSEKLANDQVATKERRQA